MTTRATPQAGLLEIEPIVAKVPGLRVGHRTARRSHRERIEHRENSWRNLGCSIGLCPGAAL
jgi:hypothetical protein